MTENHEAEPPLAITKTRTRFFGLTWDECIQAFFGGNALVAVLVLGLITLFLVREGADFFPQNRHNLEVYRRAGLEFVDLMRAPETGHIRINRELNEIRLIAMKDLMEREKLDAAAANARLAEFDAFSGRFSDAVIDLRGLGSDYGELAVAIKTKVSVQQDRLVERQQLLSAGKTAEAEAVKIEEINYAQELQPLLAVRPVYQETLQAFDRELASIAGSLPSLPSKEADDRLRGFGDKVNAFRATFPEAQQRVDSWTPDKPVSWLESFSAFLFGREWLTASFWQDWYGILPLFVGSLLVSAVALTIAVPLGVGSAIYVNQLATVREQRFIKPAIEFISAFPSVVLGFFGIVVLGELLRSVSQAPWLDWLPGFPIIERLNVLTAGCLLALISIPTIFTLAEDALNNVPRAFKEASYALGAARLQTITRIIVPAALSGIISAVLLGFGRVIGETMVVLLCAGNRIALPDFTEGLGVIGQPVHTMTGIIAQEMGEVVRGSIHYRALFMVGLVLFVLSLLINYAAQQVVRRYRISIG